MEIDKVLKFLEKYNYNYSQKNNLIFVNLELSHQVKIEFTDQNKIVIKDKLVGWNFLSGMIKMSLKSALIYNFIGTVLFGIMCMYSETLENSLNLLPVFMIFITWIILFTGFYLIKLENFKNQIINLTKE